MTEAGRALLTLYGRDGREFYPDCKRDLIPARLAPTILHDLL